MGRVRKLIVNYMAVDSWYILGIGLARLLKIWNIHMVAKTW